MPNILKDDSNNPVPQYLSEDGTHYEPMKGTNGSAFMQISGRNVMQEIVFQNAVTSAGGGNAVYMGYTDTLKITEISGTSTSRTIVFEVSNSESGTYTPIQGVKLSDYTISSQTINNNEMWQFDGLAGLWFRARVSTITGGNVTIKGKQVA